MQQQQTLSRGWRVDANLVQLGYFRTDDETVRRLSQIIGVHPDAENITLFDSSCGEGLALSDLQKAWGGTTYGIEYDSQRFVAASQRLDTVVHCDALTEFYGTGKWASFQLFNPPYGDTDSFSKEEEKTRLELEFWKRHADRTMIGGIMVIIIPDYLFDRVPAMARMISFYFCEGFWRVYRAPTQKFKQIVIIGKRSKATGSSANDKMLHELLLAISAGTADVPELPEHMDSPLFLIPSGEEPKTFDSAVLSLEMAQSLQDKFSQNEEAKFLATLESYLVPPAAKKRQRSIMPLRDGHIPAVLATGLLDGFVSDENGEYLVKGSVKQIAIQRDMKTEDPKVKKTATIYRAETVVFAWDLSTNNLEHLA